MHVYETYCRETFDEKGRLTQIQLDYPADFNFAYDVVDAMARLAPQQKALVWCNSEGQEAQFTFADISRRSSQAAQVFLQAGIRRGDRVMVALKRHYENASKTNRSASEASSREKSGSFCSSSRRKRRFSTSTT